MNLSNCVTKHDGVLKYVLSKVKPEIKPMGLYQIPQIRGHFISNVNCNKIISGHLKYRSHMDIMGKILDLSSGWYDVKWRFIHYHFILNIYI